MTQLQLQLHGPPLPKGKSGKVYAVLLGATKRKPVSALTFSGKPVTFGTSATRHIRFFRRDAWKWGKVLRDEWREKDGVRWKTFWVEEER